jgi:hypothetical protein
MAMYNFLNVINVFYLWRGDFINFFDDKPAEWLIAKKQNYQNIHTQLIHITFCKKVWSLKVHNTIMYKIKKTTLES